MTGEYLKEAISEFEIGNKAIARQILTEALANDPGDEQAWLLLAQYAETDEQKADARRHALAINPQNQLPQPALQPSGAESNSGPPDKGELELVAVVKTGPGLGKKSYDIEPVLAPLPAAPVAVQVAIADSEPAATEFKFPPRQRGKWFWASIILLGVVIFLWVDFLLLLINGKDPRLFAGAGSQPTLAFSTTPKNTQPVPAEGTPISTQPPVVTLVVTAAGIPTVGLPSVVPSSVGPRSEPVQVGSGYHFAGYGVMSVAGISWKTGQTGMAVVKLTFVCERPVEEICATEIYTFELVGSSGAAYPRLNDPSIPQPWFGNIANLPTYGGTTEQGDVGFMVSNPETGLLLKVGDTLEPGTEVYFDLP